MTNNTPSTNARRALSAAQAYDHDLRDAYADPSRPPTPAKAAGLNTAIRNGLKVAEVEALLAIAEEVAAVRRALVAGAPSTAEVTRRLDGSSIPLAPAHHPSCPVHHDGAGTCIGCGTRHVVTTTPAQPSRAEFFRRVAEAGA